MSVYGGWVLAPLVLAALALGHGLLMERACRLRLPGALLPAAGLAAFIALAGLLTILDATAEAAAPVCAIAAVAGLGLGFRGRGVTADRETVVALAVAAGAYLIFSAPSLFSGQASVAGYIKLDDSATWLAMTAYVLEHGLEVDGVAPSSYSRTLQEWLGGDYPVGAFLPLGIASRLAGVDPLAAYQAVIAACAALVALGLHAAVRGLAGTAVRAGGAALIGVQASLFFGYAQWGGIKEVVTAALLAPLALLAIESREQPRALAALGVTAGALLAVLGPNGAAWAGPALALAGALVLWPAARRRQVVRPAVAGAVALLVAALPALLSIDFIRHTTGGAISRQADFGNLVKPPPLLQGAGLWPVGDFRLDPSPLWAAVIIAGLCLLGAAGACVVAMRARRPEGPALLGVTLAGAVPAIAIGAPWIDAKALAILAPYVLVLAAALAFRPRGASGPAVAALTALAISLPAAAAWSTASVYADVQIAPRDRLAEAQELGRDLAGHGPTLVLDPEIYTTRYLMREAEGEGATDLRVRPVARYDGTQFPHLTTAEVDDVAVADLWVYRTIVRRASPATSRPPTAFERVHGGPLWEAWRRRADAAAPLARLPLGAGVDPTAVPECAAVSSLAATEGAGRLSAAARWPPVVVPVEPAEAPPGWRAGETVQPANDGTMAVTVDLPVDGRWRVWVGGGILGRLEVRVDGEPAGSRAHELGHGANWVRFDALALTAGRHTVELAYGLGIRAGRGGPAWPLGPVALSIDEDGRTLELPVSRWRELCDGRRLDWIEALG